MDEHKSKVYAKADAQRRVLCIDGGYTMENIQNVSEWTLVDEGYGDKYNLCQCNYLEKPLMDDRGVYRYKLVDGIVAERTEEEMNADYTPPAEENGNVSQENVAYEAALVELAGLLDAALIRIDEQDAALIELASILTEGGE